MVFELTFFCSLRLDCACVCECDLFCFCFSFNIVLSLWMLHAANWAICDVAMWLFTMVPNRQSTSATISACAVIEAIFFLTTYKHTAILSNVHASWYYFDASSICQTINHIRKNQNKTFFFLVCFTIVLSCLVLFNRRGN